MKKSFFIAIVSLSSIVFSSCGGELSSSSSSTDLSSSQGSSWDISSVDGTRRILAEYTSHRTFGGTSNGNYDLETLLNPDHYTEDEDAAPLYETEGYSELIDRSSEEIVFSSTPDTSLATFADSVASGDLGGAQIENLIGLLDTNDDIITESWQEFTETVLYYDYLYESYNDDYNYVKTSNFDMKRYDNLVKSGTSSSNIFYADNYSIDFTEIDQVYGDAYNVYSIHDEVYPAAFRYNAQDSIVTSPRDAGTLKQALTVGGGNHAKKWLSKYIATYDDYMNPSSENFNDAYTYELSAEKSASGIVLTFKSHRNAFEHPVDGTYYNMDLDFSVTISGGIVSAVDTYQRYTVSNI